MSKVTSKLQLTLPKAIAKEFNVKPGDEVQWVIAGDGIRLALRSSARSKLDTKEKLELFDVATQRIQSAQPTTNIASERGWTREELYERASSD